MKAGFYVAASIFFLQVQKTTAQDKCASHQYLQSELQRDPSLNARMETAGKGNALFSKTVSGTIKIPVVVHNLYHKPEEKITDAQVYSQIEALNKYFRKNNKDTANIPAYFRTLAADCEFEFQLAISDPRKRGTSGITRKYTPIEKWTTDDKMKFSAEMGTDAWDTKSYLNIWVCNLEKFAGYATMPGADSKKDGIVLSYRVFGNTGTNVYSQGKTAIHEVGHWLGLKHIWGDANCGDDGVADTPTQASYTTGCPSTVRVTCGNAPYGDMYMNFMDLTNDACLSMFTNGQKERMRALFEAGGSRESLLITKAFDMPLLSEIPVNEEDPRWLEPRLYPNPVTNTVNLDLAYDTRWIGQNIFVTNLVGQNVINLSITSKNMQIDIGKLQAGIYFLAAKRPDGVSMKLKFVKL